MYISLHLQGTFTGCVPQPGAMANQPVVVCLRGVRCGREQRRSVIEGLGLNLVPYHSVQSAGSAAVNKLNITGSTVATFTAICEPSQA